MAAGAKREIKTTLTLDGERAFKEALADSKQELKVLGSELKALTSEYKLNGDQMDYLRKKSDVLTREIAEQEKIVAQTAEMYHKAADGGEEFVGKARQLNIQLNNSQSALNRMKSELQAVDREMEELGRDSISTGRDIERGLTDAAQDASREVRDMVTEVDSSLGELKSFFSSGAGVATAVVGGIAAGMGAFSAMSDFANESAEYTLNVGKLRTNAELQSADWDFVEAEMLRVIAITGEADTAVAGISSILNTGVADAKTLNTLVNMLLGATIQYSELDFGGVAADVQKTVDQKQAVGSVAEILQNMGYDVDTVNKELSHAQTDTAALNIIMGYFAEGGLLKVYEKYDEINGKVIDSQTTQQKLNDELKTLGTNIGTWLAPAYEALAELVSLINQVFTGEKSLEEAVQYGMGMIARSAIQDPNVREMYNNLYRFAPYSWFPHMTPQELETTAELTARFNGGGNWVGQKNIGDMPEKLPEAAKAATEETLDILENFENEGEEWGKRAGATLYNNVVQSLLDAYKAIEQETGRINKLLNSLGRGSGSAGVGIVGAVAGGGNTVINMELDGNRIGTAIVPHIDRAMGSYIARTNIS